MLAGLWTIALLNYPQPALAQSAAQTPPASRTAPAAPGATAAGASAPGPAAARATAPGTPTTGTPTTGAPASGAAPASTAAAAATPAAASATGSVSASSTRAPSVPGAPCLIAQFRTIALDTHNPTERAVRAREWLQRNLPGCTTEKLSLLGSNRASWLGTADSATLMGLIDTAIETHTNNDPTLLRQLYEPTPRGFQPSVETISTEHPRPIVEQRGAASPVAPIGIINVQPGGRVGSEGTPQAGPSAPGGTGSR